MVVPSGKRSPPRRGAYGRAARASRGFGRRRPKPEISNPKPEIFNPKPEISNPKPEIFNPKPEIPQPET